MATAALACCQDTVWVETMDLDLSVEKLAEHHAYLDAAERARTEAFRFERDRHRFIARRGQLRERLAREVDEHPRALRIGVDESGKPFLRDHPQVHFNVSHSRGLALCVIGYDGPLGCDIEWRDPALACREIAARLFANAEYAELAELTGIEWRDGFFRCWTRKEAYVKALGLGLSYPLDAFRVSVDEQPRLIEAQPGWSLSSWEPAPGYQAALVTPAV